MILFFKNCQCHHTRFLLAWLNHTHRTLGYLNLTFTKSRWIEQRWCAIWVDFCLYSSTPRRAYTTMMEGTRPHGTAPIHIQITLLLPRPTMTRVLPPSCNHALCCSADWCHVAPSPIEIEANPSSSSVETPPCTEVFPTTYKNIYLTSNERFITNDAKSLMMNDEGHIKSWFSPVCVWNFKYKNNTLKYTNSNKRYLQNELHMILSNNNSLDAKTKNYLFI